MIDVGRLLYTIDEVASLLALSPHTVRKMCQRHDLATVKLGAAVRIEAAEIDRFIEKHRVPRVGESAGSTCAEPLVPVSEVVHASR